MRAYVKAIIACLALGMCSANVYADKGVESLSPELRVLLIQEMVSIQQGMQDIIPAFASGNLSAIEKIAAQMKNSYILEQKLSDKQKHELHEKLSQAFIAKDQEFHKYAGMLEHVSQKKHTELVGFYYSKLLESCVSCHSAHATHRFPALTVSAEESAHHH